MQFHKYNSIENSYQQDFIHLLFRRGLGEQTYVVQEKVHGANLSFITNGIEILTAKRTEIIADSENFFNAKTVLEAHRARILALHTDLKTRFSFETLTVFGEMFGGGYPHADVPKDATAQLVQRDVYYAPHNDFYAFDILLDGDQYLDVETANALFAAHGFVYAQTLFEGDLKSCLAHANCFPSTLPALLGLPLLEGNNCEGVVIRPVQSTLLPSGSRLLIKNKNERWSENNNAIDKNLLRTIFREDDEALSEEAKALCEEAYKFITQNRLQNLLSKLGEVNLHKESGKVLGMYNKDVLADFFKDHKARYDALEKAESKAINKFINNHASRLIVDYLAR